jgi:hypothetical protein
LNWQLEFHDGNLPPFIFDFCPGSNEPETMEVYISTHGYLRIVLKPPGGSSASYGVRFRLAYQRILEEPGNKRTDTRKKAQCKQDLSDQQW